jgi:RHS repeat-associated protein
LARRGYRRPPTPKEPPYLFTGKELDEETGLYYFGARYYDPRTSVWQSAEPILSVLLANNDRLQEFPRKLGVYSYSRLNPLLITDPDGKDYEVLVGGPYKNHPYGHVALRVFGDGYDVTYDFGRYGAASGTFNESGEGVLRVWNNKSSEYIVNENKTGRETIGYEFRTSAAQDKATMEAFDKLIKAGEKRGDDPRGFSEFVLQEDYHAITNNCTTMCILGIKAGDPKLAGQLSNPTESKGRGLGMLEKIGAGDAVGSKIFMPQDVRANIDKEKGYAERNVYKTGNPLPSSD